MTITVNGANRNVQFPWRKVSGLAVVGALVLTACAADDDPAEFEDTEQAGQAEEEVATGDSDSDPDGESGSGDEDSGATQDTDEDSAPTDAEDPGDDGADDTENGSGDTTQSGEEMTPEDEEVEYTLTVPTYEPDMGEVTVGVYPLEVEEDVMRLRLAFTPDLTSDSSIRTDQMFDTVGVGNLMLPSLNDRVNLKEYSVLGASGLTNNSGWSTGDQEIADGQTRHFWAYYAAPEDDIETINVAVAQGMPEFDDVTIDWGEASPGGSEGDE